MRPTLVTRKYGKKYVPLHVLETCARSATACDPLHGYKGKTDGERLESLFLSKRASEPEVVWAPMVTEWLRDLANAKLPKTDDCPAPQNRTDCAAHQNRTEARKHICTSATRDCAKASSESAGVVAHGGILSLSALMLGACFESHEEVRALARICPMSRKDQFRLWKVKVAEKVDLRQLATALGVGCTSAAGVELLHLYVNRSLACARQLLRALRSASRAILDALKALLHWSRGKSLEEKTAEIAKALAKAGLIIAGGLLENSLEAAVTSLAPWLAPVADLVSAAIIVTSVVLAMWMIERVVDSIACVQRAREQRYIDRAIRELSGFQVHEHLAANAAGP